MDYSKMLEGKRVFITSGQRGIGLAIALLFARQGARVALGGRRQQALDEAVAQLRVFSPQSQGYLCNLSHKEETEKTCDDVLRDFGGIDILVNTVGINKQGASHEFDDDVLETLLETNYKSGLRCARKLLPGMIERGKGNIINISSIHSEQTMPNFMLYAGTKGAMNAAGRAMALDYAHSGIRVNNIALGLIMSDVMQDEIEATPKGEPREAFMRLLKGMQPLPPGQMEDAANTALFLASEMAAYITGQTIFVDGGASAKAH